MSKVLSIFYKLISYQIKSIILNTFNTHNFFCFKKILRKNARNLRMVFRILVVSNYVYRVVCVLGCVCVLKTYKAERIRGFFELARQTEVTKKEGKTHLVKI